MGSVYKLDWNVQRYHIITVKEWYFPLLTNAVNVTLVNAHIIIYCFENQNSPLIQFGRMVATAYLAVSDSKWPRRPSFQTLFRSSGRNQISGPRHGSNVRLWESRGNVLFPSEMQWDNAGSAILSASLFGTNSNKV